MNFKELIHRIKDPVFRSKLDLIFGLGRLERILFSNWINPLATIWINFRSFPIHQAILFPLWVYGRPKIYSLSGRMVISGKVNSGMIRFNIVKVGAPGNMNCQSEIYNLGKIIFNGECEIGTGNKLVVGLNTTLSLGNKCVIMDRCCIAVHERTIIGSNTTVAHNCQIFDTNYHFIADLNKGQIDKRTSPVMIGSGCWICNSSTIMPGAKIPDYAIISSHSVVNKDFSNNAGGCIIAGIPAKVVKQHFVRVFSSKIESEIWEYCRINKNTVFPIGDKTIEELIEYQ